MEKLVKTEIGRRSGRYCHNKENRILLVSTLKTGRRRCRYFHRKDQAFFYGDGEYWEMKMPLLLKKNSLGGVSADWALQMSLCPQTKGEGRRSRTGRVQIGRRGCRYWDIKPASCWWDGLKLGVEDVVLLRTKTRIFFLGGE